MSPWTQSDFNAYQARREADVAYVRGVIAKVDKEDVLHDAIEAYCRSQGWLYVHSRMDKRTTNQTGTPDFIVALPGGVTLWAEIKKGKEKLSGAQMSVAAQLRHHDHRYVVARSLEDFVRATKESFTDMMVKAGREG